MPATLPAYTSRALRFGSKTPLRLASWSTASPKTDLPGITIGYRLRVAMARHSPASIATTQRTKIVSFIRGWITGTPGTRTSSPSRWLAENPRGSWVWGPDTPRVETSSSTMDSRFTALMRLPLSYRSVYRGLTTLTTTERNIIWERK